MRSAIRTTNYQICAAASIRADDAIVTCPESRHAFQRADERLDVRCRNGLISSDLNAFASLRAVRRSALANALFRLGQEDDAQTSLRTFRQSLNCECLDLLRGLFRVLEQAGDLEQLGRGVAAGGRFKIVQELRGNSDLVRRQ